MVTAPTADGHGSRAECECAIVLNPVPDTNTRTRSFTMRTVFASPCTLEPLVATHAPEMFRVLSDPAIYEFENEPPLSEVGLVRRYELLETRVSPDGTEQRAQLGRAGSERRPGRACPGHGAPFRRLARGVRAQQPPLAPGRGKQRGFGHAG